MYEESIHIYEKLPLCGTGVVMGLVLILLHAYGLARPTAALAALALAFVAFGVASVFADIPASAYVQDGLVVQYDAGSALSQDGKLTNLGTAGSAFDLTPVNPAKDKVADGWIHTETGWWMPAALDTAVTGTGYTIECCGRQTGNGAAARRNSGTT